MDRVGTLIRKLQQQFDSGAMPQEMLLTVRMLQAELALTGHGHVTESVSVDIHFPPATVQTNTEEPVVKIVEVLKLDESEVEAELEEIRKMAEIRNKINLHGKPVIQFDPIEDTPTLLHQTPPARKSSEINDAIHESGSSLNDRLKNDQKELAEKISYTSVKDLNKAIGVNDKFQFIHELFRGDEVMYERSIKTINGFSSFPEAEFWIKRELKLKLGWDEQSPVVKQFDQLVSRRFS